MADETKHEEQVEETTDTGGGGGGGGGEWYAGFSEETRALVDEQKWQGPEDAVKGYQNLVKLTGVPDARLVKLPKDHEDTDGWAQAFRRMGAPEKADEYDFSSVEVPEGSIDLREDLRGAAHLLNLTGTQATAFVKAAHEALSQRMQSSDSEAAEQFAAAETALKSQWGSDYERRKGNMNAGYKVLGLSDAQADEIARRVGPKAFFENLERIGRQVGESSHGKGGANGGGELRTPEWGKREMTKIENDLRDGKVKIGSTEYNERLMAASFALEGSNLPG